MPQFVHLHNHTHYSLLDGLTKLDELIEAAKADGAPAVALTDHGTMYGVIEFYQKAVKAGIKPLIGVETYLAPNKRTDKLTKFDASNYHLLLLAKNEIGYKNLIKLVSTAHLDGYYYKPRIDWEVLSQHAEGLIACSACLGGEISQYLLAGKPDKARERALEYNALFGQDHYYLEIQQHPNLPEQAKINDQLIQLSHELNIPLVATNDLHYLKKEDFDAQDVLLCLQTKKKKSDPDRMEMHGQDFYYKTAAEMYDAFADIPEALENTVKIASMCDLEIKLGEVQLPLFPVPDGYTDDTYLREICEAGLLKRYNTDYTASTTEIKERMDYELSVINKMGWPSYFLIVADFINWAKDNGIVVGPGRGSAAGSLVCYLTGITNLDPLHYDLLFERFLNPDRVSMPDIDTDFSDIRRPDVIRYVENKYGKDHVAQIITFGTMAARAAIRDVGRVMDYPYEFCDKMAKMIPQFSKIEEALNSVSELKELYQQDDAARKIIDYAKRLEGCARHSSTHACGVLITKNPLTDYVPVQYASSSDNTLISQYSLHPVEDLGLLKMDFLGLKNLTIIESAIKIIKNTRGTEIDIDNIPLDNQAAYQLFQDGETTGVFQFESSGMKRYLRELKPTDLEDIIAMVALYRPGPMEWIPDYITGKHGRKKIVYLHPKLEPILAKTHGVAIYQEQVMQMARDLAGFTMAEADVLRKAMGKKIVKLLNEQKEKFIAGCVSNGIESQLAEKIFSFIEPFAGYGFNRSHAACYALIAYQTAYLKANWPTEFMAALLTADQQDTDRIAIEIDECRKMGIEVLSPEINQSFGTFTVVTSGTATHTIVSADEKVNTIRFGLRAIKNVGENIVEVIIKERKTNGPFVDLVDLLERVTDKDLNKKSMESLVKSGALDNFGDRGRLLSNMESILAYGKEISKNKSNGQASLFGNLPTISSRPPIRLENPGTATKQEKLAWEKELLGLYISEHPMSHYRPQLERVVMPLSRMSGCSRDVNITIAGVVTSIKKIMTRSNDTMLFVKLEDYSNNIELLIFPSLYKTTTDLWQEGKVLLCQGRLSDKDQDVKFLASKAVELTPTTVDEAITRFNKIVVDDKRRNWQNKNGGQGGNGSSNNQTPPLVAAKPDSSLKIILEPECQPNILEHLKKLLIASTGQDKVYFKIFNGGQPNIIETGFRVDKTEQLINGIRQLCGNAVTVLDK
ncbi:MAG: DNA polymerase III subunit alpha [Candidatus Falkowbacteria bacterium]